MNDTANPLLQPSQTQQWAATILGTQGIWDVFGINPNGDAKNNRTTLFATSPAEVEAKATLIAGTHDVWVGMGSLTQQLPKGARGVLKYRESIHALWLDIDQLGIGHVEDDRLPVTIEDMHAIIATFPLPPTSIVSSGGGLHVYWSLSAPLAKADALPLLTKWAEHWIATADQMTADAAGKPISGYHLDSVFDITRIMRLPGTTNRKGGQQRPCVIIEFDPATTYAPEQLEEHLTCKPTEPDPKPIHTKPLNHDNVLGYIGPDRPGEHFKMRHTCQEVLQANGWTHHHADTQGGDHWTRPGKDKREGESAQIFPEDGRCVIWTSSVPGVNPRESLDPYRLLTKLEFGGDFKASSKYLRSKGYGAQHTADFRAPDVETPVDAAEEPWPEPIPMLLPSLPPPFPIDIFPPWIREFAETFSAYIQMPVDYCGMSAMAMLSAVAEKKLKINYRRSQYCNLYLLFVGPPSAGKTPAMKVMATNPIEEWQRELQDLKSDEIADVKTTRDRLASEIKDAERSVDWEKLKQLRRDLANTPELFPPLLTATDVTPEAFVQALAQQNNVFSILSGEGAIIDMMAGRSVDSKKVASLTEFCSAWSGETIAQIRKTTGSNATYEPIATMGVGTQPAVYDRITPAMRGSGLMARFMVAYPPTMVGERDFENDAIQQSVVNAMEAQYKDKVVALLRQMHSYQTVSPYDITPEAGQLLQTWKQLLEMESRKYGSLVESSEWWSKCVDSLTRSIGLLALANGQIGGVVSDVKVLDACRLAEYWLAHQVAIEQMESASDLIKSARSILFGLDGSTTWAELHHKHFHKFPTSEDLRPVIVTLIEHGYLRPGDDGPIGPRGSGRPALKLYVHPRLSEMIEDEEQGVMSLDDGILSIVKVSDKNSKRALKQAEVMERYRERRRVMMSSLGDVDLTPSGRINESTTKSETRGENTENIWVNPLSRVDLPSFRSLEVASSLNREKNESSSFFKNDSAFTENTSTRERRDFQILGSLGNLPDLGDLPDHAVKHDNTVQCVNVDGSGPTEVDPTTIPAKDFNNF